jgi:hypothetical protein
LSARDDQVGQVFGGYLHNLFSRLPKLTHGLGRKSRVDQLPYALFDQPPAYFLYFALSVLDPRDRGSDRDGANGRPAITWITLT